MAIVIESMTTTLEIHDEVKIRRLVREEIRRAAEERERDASRPEGRVDPRDPSAGTRSRRG